MVVVNFTQTFQINFSDGSEGVGRGCMGDGKMLPLMFKNRREKA